jgi:hypothetical protein
MKTRFEIWINQQHLPVESIELFNEAILCYKVAAYKAALIMSYLGFQSVLKYRLLTASKIPDGFSEEKWSKHILKNLKNEKNWDNTVFSTTQMTEEKQVFLISDDIRREVAYWKDRRNDCAHAKDNIINHSHVEAFWLFLESHLAKFIVNGGKAGLLDKIKKHYDKTYTPPNTDVKYLIEDIPHAMNIRDIPEFLYEVYEVFKRDIFPFYILDKDHETYQFWEYLANSPVDNVRNSFLDFIKSDWEVFNHFICLFPNKLNEIASDTTFIRQFWTNKIWKLFSWWSEDGWRIARLLIENKIIPDGELDDFVKELNNNVKSVPPEELIPTLSKTKYFDYMRSSLFECCKISTPPNGIDYANSNWNRIKFYITNIGLDELIVKELNSGYLVAHYGRFYEGMNALFEKNKKFKDEYKRIIIESGLTMPDSLN